MDKSGAMVGVSDAVGAMEMFEPIWEEGKMALLGTLVWIFIRWYFVTQNPTHDGSEWFNGGSHPRGENNMPMAIPYYVLKRGKLNFFGFIT